MNIISNKLYCGDCLSILKTLPDNSVDLIICSPPYENLRKYGYLNFNLQGEEWVKWAKERYIECNRVCKGLVAWVVDGITSNYRYSSTPHLLMADLHRAGIKLRRPCYYHRPGLPGIGGPDYLRNDVEIIICSSKGRLPWSNNTAHGHPPKYAPGGSMVHTVSSNIVINQWGSKIQGIPAKNKDGQIIQKKRRSHEKLTTKTHQKPKSVVLANPGNLLRDHTLLFSLLAECLKSTDNNLKEQANKIYKTLNLDKKSQLFFCTASGYNADSILAKLNEAPFPAKLAQFFIDSFCPPNGIVLDPFCGSGTTCATAIKCGRKFIGIDIRQEQINITIKRLQEIGYAYEEPSS